MNTWSTEVELTQTQEDQYLLSLHKEILTYNRWKQISKKMMARGFQKTQLQCRNRYISRLNPSLRFDDWTQEELSIVFRCYDEYGSKWNLMENFLPGRTQMNIKNRFFSTLKNLIRKLLKKFIREKEIRSIKYLSSSEVTNMYEGSGKFKNFKGLLKKILKDLNFNIKEVELVAVIEEHQAILNELGEKLVARKSFKKMEQKMKKKTNATNERQGQQERVNPKTTMMYPINPIDPINPINPINPVNPFYLHSFLWNYHHNMLGNCFYP